MKKNMKHRVLAVLSAVLCVVAMTLSVAVLPAMAYANITRNPLFAAVLAAVTENNKSKDAKEKGKGEGNRAANEEAGKNSNVGVSEDNGNAGEGAGSGAGNGAKSGNDAGDEKKQSNVPANVPEHKSNKENGEQVDKSKKNTKAKNEDAKEKAKEKAKGKDRSTGAMEKLNLEQVKKLPACEAEINEDNNKVTITSQSGTGNCAISANEKSDAFDAIREKIKSLPAGGGEIHFGNGVKAYGYGSLSKGKEGLFSGANVSYIGNGKNFDVSNVTDMSYLFKDSSLSISLFYSNAQFGNSGDLKDWDVSKVTNMEGMFEGCANLNNPNGLKDWNVSKVTNMKNMFEGCTYLADISGLSGWANKVGSVTDMSGMFEGCTGIEKLDGLANWNVGSVTNMKNMFKGKGTKGDGDVVYGSDNLTDISALSSWANRVGKVTDMSGMFEGRTSLKSLKGLENWNISSVTNMSGMFSQCASDSVFVSKVNEYENKKKYDNCMRDAASRANGNDDKKKEYESDCKAKYPGDFKSEYSDDVKKGFDISALSSWATKVGKVTDMSNMFEGCTSLKSLASLKDWDVSNVTDMKSMFASVIKDKKKRDTFETAEAYVGAMAIDSLKPLSKWNTGKVGNMNRMFEGCTSLQNLNGLENWNTRNVESMISMFEDCILIDSLEPLSKWNTGNVTDMRAMFAVCQSIQNTGNQKTNGLKNWNVSNVESMNDMFSKCTSLVDISGLSNWNKKEDGRTSQLTSTARMFNECNNITSIAALKDWDVSNVDDMSSMFRACSGLKKNLSDLASWNVGKVKDMHEMFSGCSGLNTLEGLASWNVSNVEDMHEMFSGCANTYNDPKTGLTDISALKDWAMKVGNVKKMNSMFYGCKLLKSIEPLATWNVGKVTDMSLMFFDCEKLKSLEKLSSWATKVGNVTDMHGMFKACVGLKSLDGLGSWNVSNVTNMSGMFSRADVDEIGADNLTDISALSGWNVSSVTDMSSMFADCKLLTGAADLSKWDIKKVTNLSSMFSNAGADSGDKLVLDFSNKTFTKSDKPVYTDDEGKQHYFSVKDMFNGFKGTLIANNLQSTFEEYDTDDPITTHFADSGEIFSKITVNDNDYSSSIVITNNSNIVNAYKYNYYIPVKAKLMEPGDMKKENGKIKQCDCKNSSGGTQYTYYVPALYSSIEKSSGDEEESEEPKSILRVEGESLQDYAYKIVKNSFASNLRSAIDDSQAEEQPSAEQLDSDLLSAKLKSRVKELRSARESLSVSNGSDEESGEPGGTEEQGSTYKIWFKKPAGTGTSCDWTELSEGADVAAPVSEQKSPVTFFTTMYYLETFVKPVPLPHTGGQSAVMFTFLSIGLFSMFAVAGAFGRHGWVASVLSGTALTGFAKAFGGGALDVASGAKHCFAHSVAHSVVSGSMLKTAVSVATGFFARFRTDDSTFGKHTKQR